MKKITEIEIEMYESFYISENNPILSSHIYIGNTIDPIFDSEISVSELLDKYIQENSIPGGTVTEEYRQEMLNGLDLIKKLVDEKITKVNEMPLFKRK